MVVANEQKQIMTRYHDLQRFISNDHRTSLNPARDIPISRTVSPVRRARYFNLNAILTTVFLLLRHVFPTATVEVWRTQHAR